MVDLSEPTRTVEDDVDFDFGMETDRSSSDAMGGLHVSRCQPL